MKDQSYLALLCAVVLVSGLAFADAGADTGVTAAAPLPVSSEKVMVIDGHISHDVGQVWNHVTNFGLIGSMPLRPSSFQDAPSCRWPGESSDDYLYAAGLWVGGVVLGEAMVSEGVYNFEFRCTDAASDTIFTTMHGAPGGLRYPWDGADDDGDGLEDEDPLNGLDDDGDGLVDEDFAGLGDQHFVCGYNDHETAVMEIYPDHAPLNISVVQQSIQWSSPLAEDFIGYDFTITNVGDLAIQQVYLGMFSDFDIGPAGDPGIGIDDLAGFESTVVQASDGSLIPVQVAYMHDGAATGALDGYSGWVLCGHSTDPTGAVAPMEVGVSSFQTFAGQSSYAQGGDPTNNDERYQALSLGQWDGNTPASQADDYRTLTASGPFPSLAPGESVRYQLALVMGDDLDDLLANAAEAVLIYRGSDYDRDGDPSNGDEFTVHWLPAEDSPVAAATGQLMAEIVSHGVELMIETNQDAQAGLTVIRRGASGISERRWPVSQLALIGSSGQYSVFRLLDVDPAGWPRNYDLVMEGAGSTMSLDSVGLDLPQMTAIALKASPNPFNPKVNIQFALPEAGSILLQIVDLRGHVVRTLWDGYHAGGSDTIAWQGEDASGRAMASGVYQVRLLTEGSLVKERITLVR